MRAALPRWIGAGLLVVLAMAPPALADPPIMSAPDAYRAARSGEVLLIDIRTPREWRRTGVPLYSKRATMQGPDGLDGLLRAVLAMTNGNRARPIALICATGVRSSRARAFLIRQGFTHVRDVSEGMEGHGAFAAPDKRGWLRREMPVVRCGECSVPATAPR